MSQEDCVLGVCGVLQFTGRTELRKTYLLGAKHVESTLGQDIGSIGDRLTSERNQDVSCM